MPILSWLRLIRELRNASRARSVDVTLILQGQPDIALGASLREAALQLPAARRFSIYEYCERPMHGKVALWIRMGHGRPSNLDPLACRLNRSQPVIRPTPLQQQLHEAL